MDWTNIVSQGGIWALLAFILIDKVIVPLIKNKNGHNGTANNSDCLVSHTVIIEQLRAANEARRAEAAAMHSVIEKLDYSIDKLTSAVEIACASWTAYQKKGYNR